MTDPGALDVDPEHRMIDLDSGVTLHVLDWPAAGPSTDERTPFVLTHGLASNARLWDGVARRLATAGHRVATVDQRGHGRSSKPDDGYDVATCADDLALLVGALDLGDEPVVAGQSWGGNVVLELGARHGDSIDRIVCVDGGTIDLQSRFDDWDACREALSPPRLAGVPLSRMEGWLAESAADWPDEGRAGTLANFEVRDDGTIAPWLTFERHLIVLRGLWEHRPSERYPEVAVPTLLVGADSGGDDGWTEAKRTSTADALSALTVGRAHWFVPAHHDVHAQHPDPMAQLLLDALDDGFWADPGTTTETRFEEHST